MLTNIDTLTGMQQLHRVTPGLLFHLHLELLGGVGFPRLKPKEDSKT